MLNCSVRTVSISDHTIKVTFLSRFTESSKFNDLSSTFQIFIFISAVFPAGKEEGLGE